MHVLCNKKFTSLKVREVKVKMILIHILTYFLLISTTPYLTLKLPFWTKVISGVSAISKTEPEITKCSAYYSSQRCEMGWHFFFLIVSIFEWFSSFHFEWVMWMFYNFHIGVDILLEKLRVQNSRSLQMLVKFD